MQRYFCSNKNTTFCLSSEDSYHIIKVMRCEIDDKLEMVNDGVLTICKIIDINNSIVTVTEIEKLPTDNELGIHVTIAQSLVKEQKMDYILQKSTELGVNELIGVNTERCLVKLTNKDAKKIERWQRILKEAAEQAKRNKVPEFNNIMSVKDLITLKYDVKLICTVNEKVISIKKVLSNINNDDRILIVIGPEGGFTSSEEELLTEHGFISISLGDRVLRTETASTFIMSAINYQLMR